LNYGMKGRVALVTGAAGGIGRATALAFARSEAEVVVSDVSEAGGAETVEMIRQAGGAAVFQPCDVSDARAVKALVQCALDTYGRLDFAHNNAGVNDILIDEWQDDAYARSIAVNQTGIMLCMREEVPAMLKSGGGAIVNTSSINGLIGNPAQPGYTSSKHAVVGLTRTAALRWGREGIRVNCVCPGVIDTAMVAQVMRNPRAKAAVETMTPMGRMGRPEEIASAVVWLCSDQASFVTGHPLVVDGGVVAQ